MKVTVIPGNNLKNRNHAPVVHLAQVTASPVYAGTTVTVGLTVSDAEKNVARGTFDWGDGSPIVNWLGTAPTSLDHIYAVAGNYTATSVVMDATKLVTTTTLPVTITAVPPPPSDTTAPVVTITAPANHDTVSGQFVVLQASATDAVGVTSVQFQFDGSNLGTAVTAPPWQTTWDSTSVVHLSAHDIGATARDAAGNVGTASTVTVTASNPPSADVTAPAVSVTAPTAASTVTGSVLMTATATDNVAVRDVQFTVDGVNSGAVSVGPTYSRLWDTTTAGNGSHTVRAIATDTSGNSTTSSGITVTVSNTTPPLPVPTFTNITPSSGIRGNTVAVTLTGTNFIAGDTTVSAGSGITVNSVNVSSSTSLTANFVIDSAATTGPRSVTVTTSSGVSGGRTFTVNPPPGPGIPTLTGIVPNQGTQSTTVTVTFTGTNFVVGGTTVNVSSTGITVSNTIVSSSTSLTADFTLASNALGARSVTLTTSGGTSAPSTFTINAPPPPDPIVIPPIAGLITPSSFTYLGAFRLPFLAGSGGAGFNAGAAAMGYNPTNNSLLVRLDVGLNQYNEYFAEVSIPTPIANASYVRSAANGGPLGNVNGTELNEAAIIQSPQPLFGGHLNDEVLSGRIPRGVLVDGTTLYLSAYSNYDADYLGIKSQFKRSTSFSSPTVVGPVEINAFGHGSAQNGGNCGGFMTKIPAAWQSALGGDTIAGNWNLSINGRVSWGPSMIVFTRANIGVITPVPATPLVFYWAEHPTLGVPQQDLALWNDTGLNESGSGLIFIEGTASILAINTHTDYPCYGINTTDPAQAGLPTGTGDIYCYDVETAGKGNHGYPWTQQIMAYDAHDLAAVKAGTKNMWDVVPYAHWDFTFPQFQYSHFIRSIAYDPATQRLYMAAQYGDSVGNFYNAPVIHVYQLTVS